MRGEVSGQARQSRRSLIRKHPLSKRTQIHDVQARFMAELILDMEEACLLAYHARTPSELHREWNQKPEPWEIPAVTRFMHGALACGFVCNDYAMEQCMDLYAVNARPQEMIGKMRFSELRRYIHTVQRAAKWSDGYDPIIEALASGALQLAANRLMEDERLYEPS